MRGRSKAIHNGETRTIEMTIYLMRNVTNARYSATASRTGGGRSQMQDSGVESPFKATGWSASPGRGDEPMVRRVGTLCEPQLDHTLLRQNASRCVVGRVASLLK